jgi:flagellar protein FliS
MTYGRHVQAYRTNQVMTADPGAILLMLYQGALDFLHQAKDAMGRKDMAEKGVFINKTLAIVSELLTSLNFDIGGDVARNLESLYLFMIDHITNANLYNDPRLLEETITLLSTLKEGWEGAVAAERKRVAEETATQASLIPQPSLSTRHESTVATRA